MADQLITETRSSGTLSKIEISHKHLVLVISLGALRQPELATYPLDCCTYGYIWQAILRTTQNKTARSSTVQL